METIQVSVITVVLNGAAHIQQTIDSVREQKGVSVEHIVIDGGSTDGTVDIVRSASSSIAYWKSEKDSGIADAMNKGIAQSRGTWLLFLQSDDHLICDHSLRDALSIAKRTRKDSSDILSFAINLAGKDDKQRVIRPRGFGPWMNVKCGILHQGALIKNELFSRIGSFDPQFRIAMDHDFFLRAYRRRASIGCFPSFPLSTMRDGGLGSRKDWRSLMYRFSEERSVQLKNADKLFHRVASMTFWSLYHVYRRIQYVAFTRSGDK